jgi:hypothetical protein
MQTFLISRHVKNLLPVTQVPSHPEEAPAQRRTQGSGQPKKIIRKRKLQNINTNHLG